MALPALALSGNSTNEEEKEEGDAGKNRDV